MRSKIYSIVTVFGIVLGLALATAQAQTPSKVEVDIPFEFSAGKKTLKAGVYTIKRMSGNLVRLEKTGGDSVILNAPVTLTATDSQAVERLVFNKYDEQYQLAEIWLTTDTGREVRTRATPEKPQRIELSLRTRQRE